MLNKIFNRFLHEDEEQEFKKAVSDYPKASTYFETKDYFLAAIVFVIAFYIRLGFILKFTDPQNPGDGWAGDAFHHWQIAYLTREIGLGEGFLRLWDLKGMEFFWGPLHPLLLILAFALQGSVSIVGSRILSTVFGSMVVAFLFLLGKKYWNRLTGLVAAFMAAVLPVAILDDTFGLLEQIGVALLLGGLVLVEMSPFLAGLLWALSSMVRAESWIFGIILIILSKRVLQKSGQFAQLVLGWFIPMVFYLKYLLDYTGNAVYPVYWNYLANATGAWATEILYTPYQLAIKPYLVGWFAVSVIFLILAFWKAKGGRSVFLVFMFVYWVFISGMMGLTHYLTGFQPWFWFIRFFEYPYLFLGFLISALLFYYIPKHVKLFNKAAYKSFLFVPVILIAFAAQVGFWKPIMDKYNSTRPSWEITKYIAALTAGEYKGGTLLIPDGDPNFTYALVYFNNLKAENLQGQMYDPFFYLTDEKPYENWGENREKVLAWIRDDDIRLMLVYTSTEKYMKLFEKESQYFEFIKDIPSTKLRLYKAYPERIPAEL